MAAGWTVATTASAANFEYVKSLGATHAFDHKDPNVIEDILKVLKAGDYVVDSIASEETQVACGKILGKIGGGKLPILLWPQGELPENVQAAMGKHPHLISRKFLLTTSSQWLGSWSCELGCR